jgi:hypothetical protein
MPVTTITTCKIEIDATDFSFAPNKPTTTDVAVSL